MDFGFSWRQSKRLKRYGTTNYAIAIASFSSFVVLLGLNTVATTYLAKGSTKINIEANQLVLISSIVAALIISILQDWMFGPDCHWNGILDNKFV